jgi:16S rRNA (cytosine967-C5)-methyltransferase
MESTGIPLRRVMSQSRAVKSALARLLDQALRQGLPADRALAAWLGEHRELGSRDRRLISESVYAVFRWWGWLHRLVPAETDAEADWEHLLLAAHVLEGLAYGDVLALWTDQCGLSQRVVEGAAAAASAEERAARVFRLLNAETEATQFALTGLVPEWAPAEIDCPQAIPDLIQWLQRRPPLWLRVQHPDRQAVAAELVAAGLQAAAHPKLGDAMSVVTGRINLYTLPAYREGRVEVQDLASQAVGPVCAPQPGQRWWDACAGGGGKALLLAQLMNGKGTVVASDVREHRLDEVQRRARRGRFQNIRIKGWDGQRLPADKASFDGVLVDAPCTCSGTWRRNPAARWSLKQTEIAEMAALQGRILRAAASGVKRGGTLVYVTCSLFKRENAEVVSAFLAESAGFALEPFAHPLTGAYANGMLQIWPWEGDCDAMFMAKLRRKEGAQDSERSLR